MKKAAQTRLKILQKAFELIYIKGYQNTSVDDILAKTEVTKGAFYYHFKNKDEMGLAIIEEILKPTLTDSLIAPLEKDEDPLSLIYKLMHQLLIKNEFMKPEYGCPASNLTQEMAPWHTDFNKALGELTEQWQALMISTLEQGKRKGFVRKDVNARQATLFIMSGYWGIRNFGKLNSGKATYLSYLKELKKYLASLK